jgi:hypothetical protein
VEWILNLAAAGDGGPCVDIMEISKPDDLGDVANLGLTLTEAKQLLARVQRAISTAQTREHAVRRPVCPCRHGICRVKDYRDHAVVTLFGQVPLRLPRFRCAACGRIETGINWPSHCRSTPSQGRGKRIPQRRDCRAMSHHLGTMILHRGTSLCPGWVQVERKS